MTQLLKYIISYFSILFDEYGFLIKESNNTGNKFSGASILLTSSELEIFLAIERDEITAFFRSVFDKRKNNWYSTDVILNFLGNKNSLGILNDTNSNMLRDGLPELVQRFHKNKIEETLELLDKIEKKKSRE